MMKNCSLLNPTAPSILHIATSHAWGGLEFYVVTLIKSLLNSGAKTALYCLEGSKIDSEAKKLGIPIFYGYKQARISIKDILKVRKILQIESFDVIHTHTRQDVWLGSLVKMSLKNKKHIFSLYMSAPSKKDIFHRFIYSRIDAITSSSEILNERIKKNYPIHPLNVHLLRYGREQDNFEKNQEESFTLKRLWHTSPEQLVFATICRLDSGKGVREIADSILYLPPQIKNKIKIWIIGEPTWTGCL
jgi:D-inositol-3-phosphate glycosyltransferase